MHDFVMSVLEWLTNLGYFGIAIGLMLEVVPSEIVLSYGGFMIYQGKISFIGAVIAGTIGGTLAQLFLYWMGRYGGRPFIDKYGKYVLIHEKHLRIAEKWFDKYGIGVIFFARFIPVVRHAISIPAGITKMSFVSFSLYTTLAVIPWTIFFLYLGTTLGDNWKKIETSAAPYIKDIALTALIIMCLYVGYKHLRKRKRV
jgi:membrane protein DedA with SNARE-associated domain